MSWWPKNESCLKYCFRAVIQPRNTKVEDLKRPGTQVKTSLLLIQNVIFLCLQTDASLPISFIDFDYQPSAPLSGRVAKVSLKNL